MDYTTELSLFGGPCLMVVGIGFIVAGLSTNYWVEYDDVERHFGLFKTCAAGICQELDDADYDTGGMSDEMRAIRALCIIGATFYCIALLVTVHLSFSHRTVSSWKHAWVTSLCCLVGVGLNLGGVGLFVRMEDDDDTLYTLVAAASVTVPVFAENEDRSLGYSLHLTWASTIPVFIASIWVVKMNHLFLHGGNHDQGGYPRSQSRRAEKMMKQQPYGMNGPCGQQSIGMNSYPGNNIQRGDFRGDARNDLRGHVGDMRGDMYGDMRGDLRDVRDMRGDFRGDMRADLGVGGSPYQQSKRGGGGFY